jgi:MoxR-like ATPase
VEVLSSRAKKISWPQDVPLPKLEPYFQIKSQEDLKDEKFIDLFGKDEDWYKILVGDYFINDNDFVLKPGKLLEAIKNNDKKIYLMDAPTQSRSFQAFIHRLKSERKIYVGEEVYEVPADFEIHCIKPFQQLNRPDNLNIVSGASFIETKSPPDIFYLNSETLGSLLKRNVILDKKLKTEAGWLALEEKSMQRRIIIQNGPLTSGELRQFYSMMQEYPGKVDFVDLSRVESKEMKALSTLDKFETKVLNGCFIETHDPSFLADQLKSEGDVIVHVNSKTSTAELIEYVDYKKKTKDYIHDIKQVSQALIEGKNVILAGTISHELYKALEPLMGEPPQLTLLNSSRPQRVLGRLTMLTKPVQYATSVISYANKKYNVSSEVLWQSYYTSLKKELGSAFNEEHFRRIRQFYELAGHIKHGQVGTPSMLHLNFTRIKHFMQYQQDAKHETMDNPIKSLFMHDYTKNKTNYAYLNVQAKKLFSQKEEKPGYRKEKLAAYPEDEQHLWQRLNCLNAAALRKVIPEGCTDEKTIAAHLKTWLSQNPLAILPPQKDPQAKLLKRVTATLAKHHAVVLKGPPGSGKTYLALEYAKNKGVKTFWGEKSIADWLNHTPPEGKEAVLVIDEANLSQPGTWDALMQNPKRTAQHKIIFTCNPEDYPGRSYHAVLQDIPTWYVKSWTNEGLFNHILLPMCRKAKGFDEKAHSTTLKQLLAAYHLAGQLMSKDTLSIRDLQQLTFRWLKAIEHSKDANLSAYKAAWFEWAESFMDAQKSARFKIDLTKLFGLKLELKPEPVQLGSEYYLSHSRRMLLTQIAEDMQLSAEATSTSADTAPLAKSGLLIEGASGIGKSTLLEKFLKSKQITHLEVDDLLGLRSSESKSLDSTREIKSKNNIKDFSNRYIHFTVTGDLAKDEAILLAAFNSGCKVILDELNLDPALETFLNDLLTGRTPDGKLPAHPGFFLLASQNGAGFEGINILSKALMNRLHVIYAKEDSKNDLVAMTEQALSGSLKNEWENIVEAYSVQKAQNPGEVNSRTFFDGIDQIKQLVEPSSSKNKQAISSSYVGLDSLDTTDKKPTTESSSSRVSAPSSRGSSHSGY